MPRTIERILENFKAATARRSAGKPVWDRTINIKTILDEDRDNTSDDHCAQNANRIGALVRSSVPKSWLDWGSLDMDEELLNIVEGLEALRPDSYSDDLDFSPLEDLNNMLGQLYDWADSKRIWLGL